MPPALQYNPLLELAAFLLSNRLCIHRVKQGSTLKLHLLWCCRLVGVARVPKVSEAFLDIFLMLPTDALAVMKAKLVFS